MGIENRLRRLELVSGTGEPCTECGFDGDYSKLGIITRVRRVGDVSEVPAEPGPRVCPECGRVMVIRVPGSTAAPTAR